MKRVFILVLVLSINLIAQNPNLGTSGAQFLQIPIGARNAALGSAVVGLTDDASAVFWNPAGIANVQSTSFHFTFFNWFKFFDVNAFAVAKNFGDFGILGASIIVLNMEKMEITTELEPNGTGRFFDAQDMAIGLTYARNLTDRFRFGLTMKYIYQRIWNETSNGIAFDIGTQYTLDFQNLTIAMSMTNFGPDLNMSGPDLNVVHDRNNNFPLNRLTPARLVTDDYPLPLHFQVGIGMDLFKTEFFKSRIGIDASHPNDNKERIHFGSEFTFFDMLSIRGGYKYNYDDENFTLGGGIKTVFADYKLSFDYSYSAFKILPNVHRISLNFEF
ncbi:MAG: PorV/PorQ family protein [Ignavibacteria bacterium]|nr:PorV/PorQ family protein [Ignavibacteria bacterium]